MVRYIGFSNWPTWLAAKAVGLQHEHHWAPFRAAEMYYSPVGRDLEYEMIPFVQDAGIGIMVWSPHARAINVDQPEWTMREKRNGRFVKGATRWIEQATLHLSQKPIGELV
jgi:aryl-alcohol dehydrogenase-like predicted oxidoreductase